MVLTETKVTGQAYCKNRLGYDVVCSSMVKTDAGGVQEGVGMVVQDQLKG